MKKVGNVPSWANTNPTRGKRRMERDDNCIITEDFVEKNVLNDISTKKPESAKRGGLYRLWKPAAPPHLKVSAV